MPLDTLKVYDLGQQGVNLVVSPLHQKPATELIRGQNAIFDKDSDAGGLTKRGGMAKVNASAIGGGSSVKGAYAIPLQDPGTLSSSITRGLFHEMATIVNYRFSQDYSTWANATAAIATGSNAKETPHINTQGAASAFPALGTEWIPFVQGLNGRAYWLNQSTGLSGLPEIWRSDGVTQAAVAIVPAAQMVGANATPWVTGMYLIDGYIYVTTADGTAGANNEGLFDFGRVLRFDPVNETLQQVGNAWGSNSGENGGGAPGPMGLYMGRLFVGTVNNAYTPAYVKNRVYAIRVGIDETWTLEDTLAVDGLSFTNFAVYQDELYVGTVNNLRDFGLASDVSAAALIRKRDSSGTWTTARTSGASGNTNYYAGLVTFGTKLYATYNSRIDGAGSCVIEEYNGTAWSTSLNLFGASAFNGTGPLVPGVPLVLNSRLYYPLVTRAIGVMSGTIQNILLLHNGTTWSIADQNNHSVGVDPDFLGGIFPLVD